MDEVDGMAGNEDRGGMNVCHNNSSLFFFLPYLFFPILLFIMVLSGSGVVSNSQILFDLQLGMYGYMVSLFFNLLILGNFHAVYYEYPLPKT